jgi:chromate reductase, NAD(P)H dehydrogenase (quinone)
MLVSNIMLAQPPTEMDKNVFRILGISGSGRKGSYNTALLAAAKEMLPDNVMLETYNVSSFPLFNEDLEVRMPGPIREFKRKIKEADAILFASPEYNYTVSAVLKNALEWGNRPDDDNSWEGKPAAIMSASSSPRGGARAQLHLRQIMVDLDMYPLNRPLLLVAKAEEKFDFNLRLTDARSRELLRDLLNSLVSWARKLNGVAPPVQ